MAPALHPGRVKYNKPLRTEIPTPFTTLPGKDPDYQPAQSTRSDHFTDDDDWGTIAQKYNVGVLPLIDFNFKTTDSGKVNYWLRVLVGCDTATADLTNWKFSSTAKRPWVYIPIGKIDEDPLVITAPTVHVPLNLVFKGPGNAALRWARENCNKPETWGLPSHDDPSISMPDPATLFFKAAVCAYHDTSPITNLLVPAYSRGIGIGIVLGADGRAAWRLEADYHDYPGRFDHPEEGMREVMNQWYQHGLNEGAERAQQLTKDPVAAHDLFVWLNSQISDFAKSYFGFDQRYQNWSRQTWSDYYHQCGKIMEQKLVIQ